MKAGLPYAIKYASQVQQTHFGGLSEHPDAANHGQAKLFRLASPQQLIDD